ncbi:50S ribosomal protein L4 [bacterium]|nr:50S ribosomal protein L4 [bacterium]
MKVDVYTMNGKKTSKTVELPAEIFEAPVNVDLMHQAYVRQLSNARLGTHSTKGRSDVSGGGAKPFKQKGTGRARQGSTRAAQWVGGGKIHTPKPRSYEKDMPKKMRRAALRSALSVKAGENEIIVVDELKIKEPKTKEMHSALQELVGESTALILLAVKGESEALVVRSSRNLPYAKTLLASYLNVRDLLGYEKIIIPVQAIEVISEHLGK